MHPGRDRGQAGSDGEWLSGSEEGFCILRSVTGDPEPLPAEPEPPSMPLPVKEVLGGAIGVSGAVICQELKPERRIR